MKPVIIIVAPSEVYGGGEEYIKNVVTSAEIKKKYSIYLLVASKKLASECQDSILGFTYIYPARSLSLNTLRNLFVINNAVRKLRPSLVFLNGLPEIGVYARYINSRNIVVVGHSNEGWLLDKKNKSIKRGLKWLFINGFENHIKSFIAINLVANKNTEALPRLCANTRLIYNGVREVNSRHVSVGVNNELVIFGRISRLCKGKGNEELIVAFSKLAKEYSNVRLVIAGVGDEESLLRRIVVDNEVVDKVEFVGYVSQSEFFSSIDCMISPSYMEATPLVILESMSARIPVIATSVGGVPEIIVDGVTGRLIAAKSMEAIKFQMESYLMNPEQFTGYADKAYMTYKNRFTVEKMCSSLIKVFDGALTK